MVFSKFLSNFKDLLTSSGNEKIKSTEHINEKAVGEFDLFESQEARS